MNVDNIKKISKIKLGTAFVFDDVEVSEFNTVRYINGGISEVNLYINKLTNVNSIEMFFAAYLKLLYIELFEGESQKNMEIAYSNIVSKYKIEFKSLDKNRFIDNVVNYFSIDDFKQFQSSFNEIEYVLQGCQDKNVYLIVLDDKLVLLECDNE